MYNHVFALLISIPRLNSINFYQNRPNIKLFLLTKYKFQRIGPCNANDNTAKIESKLQRRLLQLYNNDELPESVYKAIRPTGAQRPRLYGLPKTHKPNFPLRPILSMINSAQHELAKFLAALLQPVLNFYSNYCILDSFTFAEEIQKLPISTENTYLCSFDISSLFTNVPLTETIQICANKLYENEQNSPPFSKDIFIELMNMATSSVEFSFNNIMYKQIDGISMGSPLGPALANIFVGFYEQQLFRTTSKPTVYYRYVDDTFALFKLESDCDKFLSSLNSLHPALHFTFEKEVNQSLPFLDVFIEKSGNNFLTSIYRKPTFTGQYLRWDSFGPTKRKTNLIGTLVHRALKICSKSKLQQELDQIRAILLNNGYPEYIINTSISKKISKFNSAKKEGPQKCPVNLRLPWIGKVSQKFEKLSKSAVNQCYGAVDPRVIFSTKKILPAVHKDVLPTTQQSMIVYQYVCRSDCRYVGRTTQRLQDRINQHIPQSIRTGHQQQKFQPQRNCKKTSTEINCDSAIGQHLLQNKTCANNFNTNQFSILAKARTQFHLSTLEATFIRILKPELCRQKEFVYSLQLIH